MNIYFIGQTTLSPTSAQTSRIFALAKELTARNHAVTAFTATQKQFRQAAHMRVQYLPSFMPEKPGGWLYTLLSMLSAARKKADVMHIMSWKAAALIPLAAIIHPHTTIVWNVDTVPGTKRMWRKATVWLASRLCDAITTPTRALQYSFRNSFNVLPVYIPDGFEVPALAPIPTSFWKLRKNTYTLAICNTSDALLGLCKAYRKTKSRKKVTVLTNELTPALKRIQKRNSFINIIAASTPRQRTSLITQAGSIIVTEPTISNQEFLVAMESGAPLIAINHPLYQELAGTTVRFFQPNDTAYYSELLRDVFTATTKPSKATQSSKRARLHFTWQRIYEDYEILYHYPLVRRVPVDSVRSSLQSPVPLG